jgi:hypothetical protein
MQTIATTITDTNSATATPQITNQSPDIAILHSVFADCGASIHIQDMFTAFASFFAIDSRATTDTDAVTKQHHNRRSFVKQTGRKQTQAQTQEEDEQSQEQEYSEPIHVLQTRFLVALQQLHQVAFITRHPRRADHVQRQVYTMASECS